jgi:hypothetical protein
MLPKQITDLMDGFVGVFEAQHPARPEFQKIRNREILEAQVQRAAGWSSALVVRIAKKVAAHIEEKSQFVWEKFKDAITATEPELYADLNKDVKQQIQKYVNPTIEAADKFLSELRKEAGCSIGIRFGSKADLRQPLSAIDAEVDLFCARYAMNKNKSNTGGKQSIQITKFTGVLGDVSNSEVNIYDYSSLHQLLKERSVPQNERNELENVMDELKSAAPDKRPKLLEQAKTWIVKNQEFLGASVSFVRKALGLGEDTKAG